ncbi:MAG: RNA polymerase sigma factor [Candidatus Omnitrophica bacterium]|nr:RNA polymerase sigma factor [Candidatus Omnitrophota bacterium]MDD5487859.1 RNA polymerase sigma factor [Candidatus Omnitrophota bacterium]
MKDIPYELIRDTLRGDMRSFEEIYRRLSGSVYAISYRITFSRMDAEEVTQDVFVSMYKNLGNFREGTKFGAWVYRITVNAAISCYRKRKRSRGMFVNMEQAEERLGYAPELEKIHDDAETSGKVERLLAVLSPDQRACVVLRDIEGLSYEEVAQALDVKLNTVRTRLKRAREAMALRVKKEAYHEVR